MSSQYQKGTLDYLAPEILEDEEKNKGSDYSK
jgi:hypothetical protein